MSILIVDDNARMRAIIRDIVGAAADVHEAADGFEAVRLYLEFQPTFVLMDVEMGVEDGLSATRRIRTSDPRARVIIVTDHDDAETRQAATSAGACAVVAKETLNQLPHLLQVLAT